MYFYKLLTGFCLHSVALCWRLFKTKLMKFKTLIGTSARCNTITVAAPILLHWFKRGLPVVFMGTQWTGALIFYSCDVYFLSLNEPTSWNGDRDWNGNKSMPLARIWAIFVKVFIETGFLVPWLNHRQTYTQHQLIFYIIIQKYLLKYRFLKVI